MSFPIVRKFKKELEMKYKSKHKKPAKNSEKYTKVRHAEKIAQPPKKISKFSENPEVKIQPKPVIPITPLQPDVEGRPEEQKQPNRPSKKRAPEDMAMTDYEYMREVIGDLLPSFIMPVEEATRDKHHVSALSLVLKIVSSGIERAFDPPEDPRPLADEGGPARLQRAIRDLFECPPHQYGDELFDYGRLVFERTFECFFQIKNLGGGEIEEVRRGFVMQLALLVFVAGLQPDVKEWVLRNRPQCYINALMLAEIYASQKRDGLC